MVGWRTVCLLVGCLAALSQAANAQEVGGRVLIRNGVVVSGGGSGAEFGQRIDGSGPQRSVRIVIGGPDGAIDIGESLLKTCDTNQDGAATPEEVKVGLVNWLQHADTDTNSALSEVELATALKQIFPVPQPPPGFPPIPEESTLHNLLAKNLMAAVDGNMDGWMTFKEAILFVGQSLLQWDEDGGSSLDSSEFAVAFAQIMPEPPEQNFQSGRVTRRLR